MKRWQVSRQACCSSVRKSSKRITFLPWSVHMFRKTGGKLQPANLRPTGGSDDGSLPVACLSRVLPQPKPCEYRAKWPNSLPEVRAGGKCRHHVASGATTAQNGCPRPCG